jgi:hypothetical protein
VLQGGEDGTGESGRSDDGAPGVEAAGSGVARVDAERRGVRAVTPLLRFLVTSGRTLAAARSMIFWNRERSSTLMIVTWVASGLPYRPVSWSYSDFIILTRHMSMEAGTRTETTHFLTTASDLRLRAVRLASNCGQNSLSSPEKVPE